MIMSGVFFGYPVLSQVGVTANAVIGSRKLSNVEFFLLTVCQWVELIGRGVYFVLITPFDDMPLQTMIGSKFFVICVSIRGPLTAVFIVHEN